MRFLSRLSFATAALLLDAALWPATAAACRVGTPVIDASYPERYAEEVPTNAVLFVYGSQITREDIELYSQDGEVVPAEVRAVEPSGFDVEPLRELDPQRRYELRVSAPLGRSEAVAFTTGTGPANVSDTLQPPPLQALELIYDFDTCGQLSSLCIDVSQSPSTLLEARLGPRVLQGSFRSTALAYNEYFNGYDEIVRDALSGDGFREVPRADCLELRLRDVRGNRSAPSRRCGGDVERVELGYVPFDVRSMCEIFSEYLPSAAAMAAGSAMPEAATASVVPASSGTPAVSSNAGGCGLSQAGSSGSRFIWLLSGLTGLALLRRRLVDER